MILATIKNTAWAIVVFLCACSGSAPNQNASDPSGTASTENDGDNTGNSEKSDIGENGATDCGGQVCVDGQSCIEFYGFAGNKLYTCGIPCEKGAPNDGCPDGMECQVIPDGPTQCK
ncbi:MAG: hypothetical protein JXR76_23455 [Deltaproteobacteria bacterium]|nr:hypothetical protein [Deltaproteobacteria bacterium]